MSKIILFDGECNFCNYWVNFIIKYDTNDNFLFASLHSQFGQSQIKKFNISYLASDTFILIYENNYFIKSDAAFLVLRELKHWSKIFYVFKILPKKIRDAIYDFVASNRHKLNIGKSYCIIPSEKIRQKFIN